MKIVTVLIMKFFILLLPKQKPFHINFATLVTAWNIFCTYLNMERHDIYYMAYMKCTYIVSKYTCENSKE